RDPRATLFPYTTLFRSDEQRGGDADREIDHEGDGALAVIGDLHGERHALGGHELAAVASATIEERRGELVPDGHLELQVTVGHEDRKSTRLNSSHRTIS